ncbi:MAG TPA: hypothetical protein VJB66_05210 [Candidatus Nanoarchaeia archaeon]|nr:hypothetical protein [Candidatus Nanoarchaeia archaeon]
MNVKIRSDLRKIFNKHDTIGIFFGDNIDEYDLETKQIIAKFKSSKNKSEFLTLVHKVFIRMFDKKIAGSKSRYLKLSNELYARLKTEKNFI